MKKASHERGALAELWLVDPYDERVLVLRRSTPRARVFDVADVALERAPGTR